MTKLIYLAFPDTWIEDMFRNTKRGGYKITYDRRDADICVFTGGADIGPDLYGEKALKQTFTQPKRDTMDLNNFEFFDDKPKVGICRGGQFLNVMSGGAMFQHVDNHTTSHKVMDLMFTKAELLVTSTHHQMMIPGPGADILAFAAEKRATQYLSGIPRDPPKVEPEVIWYKDTKSLCFQPHPEIPKHPECTDYFFDLMDYFFL